MAADPELAGRRVLITGATKGIGRAVAGAFAGAGAEVVAVSSGSDGAAVADAIAAESGGSVTAFRCDVSDRDAVRALAADVGPVDVLVNNAGIAFPTPIDDASDECADRFARMIEVNLNAAFWVTRAFAGSLPDGRGRVIFTGSILSRAATGGMSAYTASKHGLLGLAKTLAIELGVRGITVNSVLPGTVATETNVTNLSGDFLDALVGQMCLNPGLIPAEKLTGTFLFLASDAASEITGQAIAVDRGQLLG